MRTASLLALFVPAVAPAAGAQYLLAVNSEQNDVLLLDDFDGSILDPFYIDLSLVGGSTPIEALVVGNEIWISNQVGDKLSRFSLDGNTHLGDITGGMDNIRGIELVGAEVWVSNSGGGGGAPGDAIVRFSTAGANLGSFAVPDPFDVVNYQGGVLIADIANEDIQRYTSAGAFVSVFHASAPGGLNFPMQLVVRANGNVLVGGSSTPSGIYEFDPAGAQISYWSQPSSARGVAELGNGKLLYTTSEGIHTFDPGTLLTATILGGVSCRYVTRFAGANPPVPYCFGDGSGTPCPCTPVPLVGDADKGCPNSFNAGGGKLAASGSASISADTLVMTCTLINNGGAVVFQGTNDNGGGLGTAFGDGLRCAAGSVRRMRSHAVSTNTHQYPDPMFGDNAISIRGAVLAPGDRWYQGWYRSGLAHCDPTQNYNLTNGVRITWVP